MSDAKPWAIRIPAAIEKADRLTAGAAPFSVFGSSKHPSCITRGEVALAHHFWKRYAEGLTDSDLDYYLPKEAPSLIAFAEKVEAL